MKVLKKCHLIAKSILSPVNQGNKVKVLVQAVKRFLSPSFKS
jgi:hypothetical protein